MDNIVYEYDWLKMNAVELKWKLNRFRVEHYYITQLEALTLLGICAQTYYDIIKLSWHTPKLETLVKLHFLYTYY